MRSSRRRGLGAVFGVTVLAMAGPALAASTDVVLDLEGNPTCSSLTENAAIITLRDTSVQAGELITLSGPQGQSIEAQVNLAGTSIEFFTSDVPTNFVVLKGQGPTGAIVYHYGVFGTTGDTVLDGPDSTTISQATWCYGLTDDVETEPLPSCAELGEDAPQCPLDGAVEQNGLLIFFDFDAVNFGVDANQCTCGNTELNDCDEGASATGTNTCAGGTLQQVPVQVEGIQNPATTVCTTVAGKRVCKTS
jgi:hypothetical protein